MGLPALPDFHFPVEDFKFYVVYWKDIESDPSWRELKDIQASVPAICISTGWLVKQNKDVHILMSDFNFNKEGKLIPPTQQADDHFQMIHELNQIINQKNEQIRMLTLIKDEELLELKYKFN